MCRVIFFKEPCVNYIDINRGRILIPDPEAMGGHYFVESLRPVVFHGRKVDALPLEGRL
jgi:hypothetical protein